MNKIKYVVWLAMIVAGLVGLAFSVGLVFAEDDLPPSQDIDYRCEEPAYTDFIDKVPTQPGEANAYTITLPDNVIACHVDFYPTENTVPVSIAAPMAITTCHGDGYCAKGLGTFKAYTNGQFSFWWNETQPVWVRVYFRLLIPGEHAPTLTPTPTPTGTEPPEQEPISPDPTPQPTPTDGFAPPPLVPPCANQANCLYLPMQIR